MITDQEIEDIAREIREEAVTSQARTKPCECKAEKKDDTKALDKIEESISKLSNEIKDKQASIDGLRVISNDCNKQISVLRKRIVELETTISVMSGQMSTELAATAKADAKTVHDIYRSVALKIVCVTEAIHVAKTTMRRERAGAIALAAVQCLDFPDHWWSGRDDKLTVAQWVQEFARIADKGPPEPSK